MDTITITSFFNNPANIGIYGPSGCGKTTITKEIIKHKDELFLHSINDVVYCYSNFQDIYNTMGDIILYNGFPTVNKIEEWSQKFKFQGYLLIIDDFMVEASAPELMKEAEAIFCKHARHNNVTIIWLAQNIFMKNSRTLSLNTHYFIPLSTKRDRLQLATFGRQIFPSKSHDFMNIYDDAIKSSYRKNCPGYMVINCHPFHSEYRIMTCIFPDESEPILYKLN